MTVSTTTSEARFTGNGTTTVFPLGFEVEAAEHLVVTLVDANAAESVRTLNVHYTVSDVGEETGATVTMVTAPAVGEFLLVQRVTPRTQPNVLLPNAGFSPAAVEAALDRMALIVQEAASINDRGLKTQIGETINDLPSAAARANSTLLFDASGQPTVGTVSTTELIVSAYMQTLLGSSSEEALAQNLTIFATRAADRTELKTRDAQAGDTVLLAEAGRAGFFVFRAGDYSTEIAADTQEGIYVKATSVAASAGAWVRIYNGPALMKWFGIAGDGTTDDTSAFIAAVSACRTLDIPLDGEGCTVLISAALTVVPGEVRNFTLDASGITATRAWTIDGPAFDSSVNLTANYAMTSRSFSATGHTFVVGEVVLVTSDLVLEAETNSLCAHWGEVTAVSGAAVTLSHAPLCVLNTADNALARRLPYSRPPVLKGVTVLCSSTCKNAIQLQRWIRPVVEDYESFNAEDRGLSILQCYQPRTGVVRGNHCDTPGLGYALNVNGCGWPEIGDTYGLECRHVVTYGVSGGVPTIGGTFGSVFGAQCTGSVLDTHPGVIDLYQRADGVIFGDMITTEADQDAVTWQGAGGRFNCVIRGAVSRHICLIQPYHVLAALSRPRSVEAKIEGRTENGNGVFADIQSDAGFGLLRIDFNGRATSTGVLVSVSNGSAVEELEISGNVLSSGGRAVYINQNTSGGIQHVKITGRMRTSHTIDAVDIRGATDAGVARTQITFAHLFAAGGTYGLRVDNRADARGLAAAYLSGSSAASQTNGGGTIA